jgi:hypothetical protein
MDKCGLCLAQINMKLVQHVLGHFLSNKLMVYSMYNIDGKVCNCKFNNLFHLVWFMDPHEMWITQVWAIGRSYMKLGPTIAMVNFITLALGSQPKQGKGLQRWGPRRKPGNHISCSHECRRMWGNSFPHTTKWAPTLGVGVLMDSRIFREWLQGSKPIGLRSSLYRWKVLGT